MWSRGNMKLTQYNTRDNGGADHIFSFLVYILHGLNEMFIHGEMCIDLTHQKQSGEF